MEVKVDLKDVSAYVSTLQAEMGEAWWSWLVKKCTDIKVRFWEESTSAPAYVKPGEHDSNQVLICRDKVFSAPGVGYVRLPRLRSPLKGGGGNTPEDDTPTVWYRFKDHPAPHLRVWWDDLLKANVELIKWARTQPPGEHAVGLTVKVMSPSEARRILDESAW
jgi:hypothetical protein